MAARRVRIGVVGCGAIAQCQHLPNLLERPEQWQVQAVCDVSPGLVEAVGERFGIAGRFTDYRDLIASDVEALILCLTDPKAPVAIAAAEAGKHVLIEKPICYTVSEADDILRAARKGGGVAMAAYMKQHEPGYRYARERILAMRDIRFIQVNHLHPDNKLHMQEFRVLHSDDIPRAAREEWTRRREARIAEAIGAEATPLERRAFDLLIGSMIHDLSCLRGIFGPPERVVSAEVWLDGRGFTTVLAYPGDRRCVATWVDLPDLWDFKETLEVYGSEERVLLSFPTGFSRGLATVVTMQGSDGGVPWRKELSLSRDPGFQAELEQYYQCIVEGAPPLTGIAGARDDAALVRAIIEAARRRGVALAPEGPLGQVFPRT